MVCLFFVVPRLAGTAFRYGALPHTPQGTLSLDPAKGWRALGWAQCYPLCAVQYLLCDPATNNVPPL